MQVGEHRLELVVAPDDRLAALIDVISRATRSLRLTYYTFAADSVGRHVVAALAAAAARGVAVNLLVDSFGSAETPDALFDPLRKAGGEVRYFGARWSLRYLVRNHQKITLADGREALIGGYNIGNDDFAPPEDNGWADSGVVISGPIVAQLDDYMRRLWSLAESGRVNWRALRRLVRVWKAEHGALSLHLGGPGRRPSPWAVNLLRDMEAAARIDMSMAYFTPSTGIMRRVGRMARQTGALHLVLPSKSDNGATIGASRLFYGFLLRRGARIFEYLSTKLHRKLVVADDVAYIGSANFDVRSLYINVEIMLRVQDAGFAAAVRDVLDDAKAASREVLLAEHKRRAGPITRLRWWLSWLIVAAADYNVSRRINFGVKD